MEAIVLFHEGVVGIYKGGARFTSIIWKLGDKVYVLLDDDTKSFSYGINYHF